MAAPVTPSTPTTQTAQVSTSPTGTWRHPRFDEIARRQSACTFGERNVRKIVWNGVALVASFFAASILSNYSLYRSLVAILSPFSIYSLFLFRSLLVFNIVAALAPLMRRKDDLADIPLTPSQRALLGLNPNTGTPTTPGAQYITPPRYQKSSTPRSGSRSTSYSGSPASGRGSPTGGRGASGSPFTPSASPLLHKAVGGGARDTNRRQSYSSPSPLAPSGTGWDVSMLGVPTSPSPSPGKGASVGLNSRWLYERGRASPRSSSALFS